MNERLTDRRLARIPIAIVGMSGLFPMARNHREYWQNIVDGVDCSQEVPASRWKLDDYHDPDPDAPDKTYSRRGAFLPDIDFDPLEFGLPPNQLDVTSMMQVLSLGVARDLLIDASAPESEWYDASRTGVVLGAAGAPTLTHPLSCRLSTPVLKRVVESCGLSERDADEIAAKYVKAFAPWQENSFPGYLANVVAGRIANRFGLGGMNCTVDAACAASLSAIRLAIAELVDDRADMMITGGVDTDSSIFTYLCFSKVGALSRTDRIMPFSDSADGTMVGEGIGMIALRRLADAEQDGNRIYAVIRGIGSSSDGRATSIYAPRAEGQRLALERAYADAECSPGSVELFEAHGTGTVVGDRVELAALGALLRGASAQPRFAALGSVKSQIGHTKGAAGTASLMKLAFALYHRVLPGTINVEKPNDAIAEPDAPFYVNVKTRPWILDPGRPIRRAGVSSLGFGGTNFHFVLEEYEPGRNTVRLLHRTAMAYLWHAPDRSSLLELLRSGDAGTDGGDIPVEHARIGFVAKEDQFTDLVEVAIEHLASDNEVDEWSHPRGIFYRKRALPDPRIGALFAGQGSQYVEMGLDAALNIPAVAQAFDALNGHFADAATTLAQVLFPPPTSDGESAQQETMLRRTEYTQPAIAALCVGQFRYLAELGLSCSAFAGHSFGELTALWAAGSLSDSDYGRLTLARGLAMAPPSDGDSGAMVAIQASREIVADLLQAYPAVQICNHNAPDQVVVGGATPNVRDVMQACGHRGIKARLLPLAAAYHTHHVAYAVDAFRASVNEVRVGEPNRPVYPNTPGASYGPDAEANANTIVRQLTEPVEFVATLRSMRADGVNVFVEFGPKQTLTQLVRQTLGDEVPAIPTDAGPLGSSDTALKRAAVRLAVIGVPMSGINRYAAPPSKVVVPKGPTVSLSAHEYVSEERRAAYQDALTNGYRVALGSSDLTADPRDSYPVVEPVMNPAPRPTRANTHSKTRRPVGGMNQASNPTDPAVEGYVSSPMDQHLALHGRYLESQLRVAEEMADALKQPVDPQLSEAIVAVAQQSVAISQAHARASEILAALADLESGEQDANDTHRMSTATQVGSRWTEIEVQDLRGTRLEQANDHVPTHQQIASVNTVPVLPSTAPVHEVMPARPTPMVEVVQNQLESPSRPTPAPTLTPQPALVPAATNGAADVELRSVLLDVIAEKTGYPADIVDPTMDLEMDLGVDSIKRVQVIGAMLERLPDLPSIDSSQLADLRTVDQIVNHLTAGDASPKARSAGATVPRQVVELVRLPTIDLIEQPYPADPVVVLFDTGRADGDALAVALAAQGWKVHRAAPGVGIDTEFANRVDLCLLLVDTAEEWDEAKRSLSEAIMTAKRAARLLDHTHGRAGFVTVTRLDGGLGLHGSRGPVASLVGGVGGVVKTLAAERPEIFCRAVDIAPDRSTGDFVADLMDEIRDAAADTLEIGVDADGVRRTVVPSRHGVALTVSTVDPERTAEPVTLTAGDLVLVTGGGRSVTAACVRALAARTQARFVLLGRTQLVPEPDWARGVADADLRLAVIAGLSAAGSKPSPREVQRWERDLLAQRDIRRTLASLGNRGEYLSVDITDPDAVRTALSEHRGEVTCLVHGAGVLADAMVADKTIAQIDRVFGTKLDGLRNVLDVVNGPKMSHLVLFTSGAGLLGNPGQVDYATANEALCRFASGWKLQNPTWHVTAIDWTAWNFGMVTPELAQVFKARGVQLLDPVLGGRAFVEQFTKRRSGDTRVLIGGDTPLGGLNRSPCPAFAARRAIAGLLADPVIQAHRVGIDLVLPASFGLGWLINVVERSHPGLSVVQAVDFQVNNGIVLDDTLRGSYRVEVGPGRRDGELVVVDAAVRSDGDGGRVRSHYVARFVLAPQAERRPTIDVRSPGDGPGDPVRIYLQAVQFHGPRLQGIRRVLERSRQRLVLQCQIADAAVGDGAFAGRLHRPVLADVLLQGPPVLGKDLLGAACMPLGISRAEWFAPLPDDEPFIVVLDGATRTAHSATITATATDFAGRVFCRFAGVTVVSTKDLDVKFQEAVRRWCEAEPSQEARPS